MHSSSTRTESRGFDLNPLPFLEKTLPIGAVIISTHLILMASKKIEVLGVCIAYIVCNVLFSKLLHNKNSINERLGEIAKLLLCVLGVSFSTVFFSLAAPVWLLHLLYVFRIPLAVKGKWERIAFLELLSFGAAIGLFLNGAGIQSILPIGLFHLVYILSSSFISFFGR